MRKPGEDGICGIFHVPNFCMICMSISLRLDVPFCVHLPRSRPFASAHSERRSPVDVKHRKSGAISFKT